MNILASENNDTIDDFIKNHIQLCKMLAITIQRVTRFPDFTTWCLIS